MSAQAGVVPRRGIRLDSRLRATARSEWIKFRSVRSGPFALATTALIVVVGAWLLGAVAFIGLADGTVRNLSLIHI